VSADIAQAREELLAAQRLLHERGLNVSASGNVSVRVPGGLLVTPSAIPPDESTPASMVEMGLDGSLRSDGVPTSEWRIHRDIYVAYPQAEAVVHTHSTHATALACLREDLPPFHYKVGIAGGHVIRCAVYATFGTQELSDNVIAALGSNTACLMANHGMVAYATTLPKAVAMATDVEVMCQQYLAARAAGTPVLLSAAQMDEAISRFANYGTPESFTG
jgi:L-fuculose-phosphate aldolase